MTLDRYSNIDTSNYFPKTGRV